MKKIILPIFLLLSLIVKSQTLSIDSSLEMTIKDSIGIFLQEDERNFRANNISFKSISQSYFNSLNISEDGNVLVMGQEITMPDGIPNIVLLISSDYSVYSRRLDGQTMVTGFQLLQVDSILALKSIIDEVYIFRKNKNFNFSFGEDIYTISGNFTNGKLFLNFLNLYDGFIPDDFLRNLRKVNSIGNEAKFTVTLNLNQIKSLRKFLNKALK
jgi:hypothetical protein